MNTDYLSVIENYILKLNVPYKKEILTSGVISYFFDDFSSGIIHIQVIQEGNISTGFSIKCLHNEMNKLTQLADMSNSLLNVPILQYMILDQDKMTPQIIAVIKK